MTLQLFQNHTVSVVLTGDNFLAESRVRFRYPGETHRYPGVSSTNVEVISKTEIQADIVVSGTSPVGLGELFVRTAGGDSVVLPFSVGLGFRRVTDGLLARYDVVNAAVPFNTAHWTLPANVTLSIIGSGPSTGRMRITYADTAANDLRIVGHTAIGDVSSVLIQMLANVQDLGAVWGPVARATVGNTYSNACGCKLKTAFALQGDDSYTIFEAHGGISQSDNTPGNQKNTASDFRFHLLVNMTSIKSRVDTIATYDKSLVPNFPGAGKVGIFHRSDFFSRMDVGVWIACGGRYIQMSGPTVLDTMVVKVHKADNTVVASAVVSSGSAFVDMWGILLDGSAHHISLYQAGGIVLIDSLTPAGGVWPGDVYDR